MVRVERHVNRARNPTRRPSLRIRPNSQPRVVRGLFVAVEVGNGVEI